MSPSAAGARSAPSSSARAPERYALPTFPREASQISTPMKLNITQVRSVIRRPETQKLTMKALGLRRMHQTVEHDDTPTVRGMVAKVQHLIQVSEG